MTLQVVDGLDDRIAQKSLFKMAVEMILKLDIKATKRDSERGVLNSSNVSEILWKHVLHTADNSTFDTVVKHFKNTDPSELGPVIEVFSQYVDDLDEGDETFAAL